VTTGPAIEHLTRRLTACPPVFLDPGGFDMRAVAADLLRDLAGDPLLRIATDAIVVPPLPPHPKPQNRRNVVAVALWLLHDPAFHGLGYVRAATELLAHGLDPLAEVVEAPLFVSDPDRREELVRVVLQALSLQPEGETAEQASDRLTTLDSAERVRVIRDTQIAEERARRVQEALRKKAEEEAAAKAMRE
jgi:hypothetical protein